MVDLIGDLCIPSELIVPTRNVAAQQPAISGALFLSGAKLYFVYGTPRLITSA